MLDALAPGSFLAFSHATGDFVDPALAKIGEEIYRSQGIPFQLRSKVELERFFTGLELLEPGLVPTHRWRPDGTAAEVPDSDVGSYAAVARTP